MKAIDRQASINWDEFKKSVFHETTIDHNESAVEAQKRRAKLEANVEEWFKYYFPNYCYAEPADFHKRATRRLLANEQWYEVRAWSRELAKTARAMMEVLFLTLVKKYKNVLLISYSYDNAVNLIMPYQINLESNQRINHDYGTQASLGNWETGNFKTSTGIAFRAIGAGQSPRGTRNEHARPDIILIDDMDTDEECRNQKRVEDKWNWIEQALIPTVSVSGRWLFLFLGNIIAKESCIVKAIRKADHSSVINIRNDKGESSWPQKNSEEAIDKLLNKISYVSSQKEYYNNPLSVGTVFKEITYKQPKPIKDYHMLVCYTDPSFKDSKKNDFKATILVGRWKDEIHVIRAYLEQTSTAKMVEWHYDIMQFIGEHACYYYMEANFLQDIILQEFHKQSIEKGKMVPIKGDDRKKPDKFTRIESLLEPLNSNGKLFFNERERDNPNMVRLEDQFKALEPGSRAHDDGPDAVEGAVWIINNKAKSLAPVSTVQFTRYHKNRY